MTPNQNPNQKPIQVIEEDVWDDEIDGDPAGVADGSSVPGNAGYRDVSQQRPAPQSLAGAGLNNPAIPEHLKRVIEAKKAELARVTEVLQPQPMGHNTYYQPKNPLLIPTIIASGAATVTLLGMTAIILSALPNAQITRQQEMMSAVTIEVARRPPNYTCIMALDCPEPAAYQPITQQGDQLNVTSGDAGQMQAQAQQAQAQPQQQPAPQPVAEHIELYEPPADRYQEWFNYWALGTMSEIHEAAASYTDVDCNQDPDMCQALNTVKRIRMERGER